MWRLEINAVLPLRETRRAEGGGSRIQWIQVTVSDCCVFRPHTLFPRTIFSPLVHCFRTVVEIKGNSVSRAFSTVLDTQYPRKHLAKGFYQEVHLHPKLMRGTGPLTTFLYLGWTSFLLSPLPFSFISECICLGLTWSVLTWSWVLLALWGFLWQLNSDLIAAICSDGLRGATRSWGGSSLISAQISHSA